MAIEIVIFPIKKMAIFQFDMYQITRGYPTSLYLISIFVQVAPQFCPRLKRHRSGFLAKDLQRSSQILFVCKVDVRLCLLMSVDVCWRLLMSIDVYWCLLMSVDVCWCLLMSLHVVRCSWKKISPSDCGKLDVNTAICVGLGRNGGWDL